MRDLRKLTHGHRESLEAIAAISPDVFEELRRGISQRTTFTLGPLIIRIKDKSQIDKYAYAPGLGPTMEATLILLQHNAMIEFNPIPALARRAISVRRWPAPHALRGKAQTFGWDRASDAHARADALCGGDSLREAA